MALYKTIRAFSLAALALVAIGSPVAAKSAGTNQLKAAIVFNILRFVQFAPGASGSAVDLCIQSNVEAQKELASLHRKTIGSRSIAVRTIDSSNTAGCDIVYLGSASRGEISQARRTGRVLIGDGPAFIRAGGMIGLVRTGNQIRFEVNLRSARQSDVTVSSKILRLAARVQQ